MPGPSPAYPPPFSAADVAALQHLVRRPTTEQRYVQRAQVALLRAAEPTVSNTAAGERLGKPPNWVFTWRKRGAQAGFALTALADRPRVGRPRTVSPPWWKRQPSPSPVSSRPSARSR
jgi:hypothetical protein